jgi:DNA-binding transcriptional MerR regulator
MSEPRKTTETTYPLGAAARLTGLSPELLRAWERRYGVVEPLRTPGGTRRYRAADVERLRLLKAVVDTGHRVGRVAHLETEELERLASRDTLVPDGPVAAVIEALEAFDGAGVQHLLSLQLAARGPNRFARELAAPLVHEIGDRWADGRISVAAEHLATGLLQTMLGTSLQPTAVSLAGPRIVFGTPSGERHELGLLMAAITAMGAGANPVFLGADLPVESLLDAMDRSGAVALALSIVTLPAAQANRTLRAIRGGLPDSAHVWIGGPGANELEPGDGIDYIRGLDALEQRVGLLGFERPSPT